MKPAAAIRLAVILAVPAASAAGAPAASFREAKVSEVVREVSLLVPPASVERASVGDRVAGSTTVRTGAKSRTELTFPDSTLLRLGSNTQFSFIGEERDFELQHGTAVLKTTRESGGARIRSGGVTAAITGSMAAIVKPPPGQAGVVKLLLFYGDASMLVPEKKLFGFGNRRGAAPKLKEIPLKAGQIAFVAINESGAPVGDVKVFRFDAALTAKTSNLMDADEEKLKEELEGSSNSRVPTTPNGNPVSGTNDIVTRPDGVLGRILSIFAPDEETPETAGPRCPDGFFFDDDFQECFPGACPDGTVFDHFTQQCVAAGQGGG